VTVAVESLAGLLTSVATHEAGRFRDHRLVIRRSRVVHDLGWLRWMAGIVLPAPACHVGVAGWALEDLHPTLDPVTCLRCLHAAPGGRVAAPAHAGEPGQLTLPIELRRAETR
jgi:hypothetical protein